MDTIKLPGKVRREQIIQAALKVMSEQGYPKFTLRNVAKHAGIHFATLQYYFKNKNKLLSALFEYKIKEDARVFHEAIGNDGRPVKQRFSAAIKLILEENRQPLVIGYFLQFWALTNHDRVAARYLDEFYDAYFGWIIELITLASPDTSAPEKNLRARSILALLEGLVPTYNCIPGNRIPDETLDQYIIDTVWQIAIG